MATGNRNSRNKQFNRGKGRNKGKESNNYQDMSEEREYKKGFKAGSAAVPINTGAKKDNDPSWYSLNPTLLRDAGTFPFSAVNGYPFDVSYGSQPYSSSGYPNYFSVRKRMNTPGILVLRTGSALGTNAETNNPAGPVTVALNALYSFIRKANSGATNYDQNVVGMYVLSISDAYALYSWLVRAYGVMTSYSAVSTYRPKQVFEAMGLDFEDFKSNAADFRMVINQLAFQLQSRALPKAIMYTTRHIWMYENIYKDSDTNTGKEQLIMYNPIGFMQFYEQANPAELRLTSPNDGAPKGKGVIRYGIGAGNATLITFSKLEQYVNQFIEPIMASQDFGTISGDMSKAFGDGAMMKVLGISETYTVTPVYSREVMSQIENAKTVNIDLNNLGGANYLQNYYTLSTSIGTSFIQQNMHLLIPNNSLIFNALIGAINYDNALVNMHMDTVTPEDMVVATRLTHCGWVPNQGTSQVPSYAEWDVNNLASDYVYDMRLFYNEWNETISKMQPTSKLITTLMAYGYDQSESPTGEQAFANAFSDIHKIAELMKFDWAPIVNFAAFYKDGENIVKSWGSDYFVDLDNYTHINKADLDMLNRVAMISLISARDMGSYTPSV